VPIVGFFISSKLSPIQPGEVSPGSVSWSSSTEKSSSSEYVLRLLTDLALHKDAQHIGVEFDP
jgi:hypothetical protein